MKREESYAATVEKFGGSTQAIIDFSNNDTCQELDAYYRQKSNLEVIGRHRKELVHSRILAWLLAPTEFHGLGSFPLKKFLEACVLCQMDSLQKPLQGIPANVLDEILVDQTEIEGAQVFWEYPITEGRVDVLAQVVLKTANKEKRRLWILVENKVDSSEHNSQTQRYRKWVESSSGGFEYYLLVYLTPETSINLVRLEEPDCDCKDFHQINYQYLLENLFEPSRNRTTSEQARGLLDDYIRALSVPASSISDGSNTGDEIMAISGKERNLLAAFFDRYEPLIKASLYAISIDPERTDEERTEIQDDLNVVRDYTGDTKCNRDYSRYSILKRGEAVMKGVKKAALGYEVVKQLLEDGLSEAAFAELRADKSSRIQLLKTADEITEGENKYNKYGVGNRPALLFKGTQYFVSSNWGDCNLPRFQDFLRNSSWGSHIELVKEGVAV